MEASKIIIPPVDQRFYGEEETDTNVWAPLDSARKIEKTLSDESARGEIIEKLKQSTDNLIGFLSSENIKTRQIVFTGASTELAILFLKARGLDISTKDRALVLDRNANLNFRENGYSPNASPDAVVVDEYAQSFTKADQLLKGIKTQRKLAVFAMPNPNDIEITNKMKFLFYKMRGSFFAGIQDTNLTKFLSEFATGVSTINSIKTGSLIKYEDDVYWNRKTFTKRQEGFISEAEAKFGACKSIVETELGK